MAIKRVVRVKSCNANKNQECFVARRGSRKARRSRPKMRSVRKRSRSRPIRHISKSRRRRLLSRKTSKHRSIRRSRRRSHKISRRRSHKISRRKSHKTHKGLVLSKSKDINSQIKNFFKIDQEIIYIIQHPRKAKRKNVLKLLGLILIFLILLCGIMKYLGGSYDYCTPVINKLKELINSIKSGGVDPIAALKDIRSKLGELWNGFIKFAPVATVLAGLGTAKGKLGDKLNTLFTKKVEESGDDGGLETEPRLSLNELSRGIYTVKQIKDNLRGTAYLVAFNNMIDSNEWNEDSKPKEEELLFLKEVAT